MKPIEQVPAAVASERLKNGGDFVLLDCRESEELAIARIQGAMHVPMGDIPSRLPQLDPDVETVVFCHHGVRSQKVAGFLREQGFANVKSLRGGIDAWSVEVDPRVPRY